MVKLVNQTLLHLPKEKLVAEKIFMALPARQKERDFYDLYYLLRKGMLSIKQKQKLAKMKTNLLKWADKKNFRHELGVLLPVDQQPIIANFYHTLSDELTRQIADI